MEEASNGDYSTCFSASQDGQCANEAIRAVCPKTCQTNRPECDETNEPTPVPEAAAGASAPVSAGHKFWVVFDGSVEDVTDEDKSNIEQACPPPCLREHACIRMLAARMMDGRTDGRTDGCRRSRWGWT